MLQSDKSLTVRTQIEFVKLVVYIYHGHCHNICILQNHLFIITMTGY